jgi:4-amino-4-deoxy-L-arabinose transferase-like glycosyltransferase
LLMFQQREAKWYLLAGLCAGLAGATKYNGAIAVLIPLTAHVLATTWGEWGWLNGRLLLTVGGFAAGFLGGNPFAVGHMPDFLNGLALVLHHYGTQQPGFEGTGNWRWYLKVFLTSPDSLFFVAGLVGLGGIVWRKWRMGLVVIVFPLAYFVLVSRFVVRFERNMVPLLPFLAIGAGWFVDKTSGWLGRKLTPGRAWSDLFAIFGVLLLLLLPLLAGIGLGRQLSDTDHRQVAGQWLEQNLAPGSKIAVEHYSVPLDDTLFEVTDVLRIDDHDLEWYREEGFDALIVSDGVWPVLRQQPEVYGDRLLALDDLVSNAEVLAEFVPRPLGIITAGYPTVAVYHYAPVRIYRVQD